MTKLDEMKKAMKKKAERENAKPPRDDSNLDELTKQIQTAEEEAKAHYDKLLRAMAELDNFKKRTEREKQDFVRYSNQSIVTDLLPITDALDKVLEHSPEEATEELKNFVEGVKLISKQFANVLAKYGVIEIATDGAEFNPEIHEAVAHIPDEKVKENFVVECHRKGYTLNDRVIRPAMVTVSKGRVKI